MPYSIEIRPAALRDLERLPVADRRRVGARIDALADAPRPPGCVKLRGLDEVYRVRVGVYRVLYLVRDRVLTVTVVRVGHRREAYRGL